MTVSGGGAKHGSCGVGYVALVKEGVCPLGVVPHSPGSHARETDGATHGRNECHSFVVALYAACQ